jgi:hypothetical protein
VTTPTTQGIRWPQTAAIVLLFAAVFVVRPLAFVSRMEHSHPLASDGQQLAHSHPRRGAGLVDDRSHHHHDQSHHHHNHAHHHHAKTGVTEKHGDSPPSRITTKSEVSSSSRHQHFNLFGLSFTIHCGGRSNAATDFEEGRSVDFGCLVMRLLDIRCPMPPADVIVDSSLIWQSFLSYHCLDDSCEADQPDTPPPESPFC